LRTLDVPGAVAPVAATQTPERVIAGALPPALSALEQTVLKTDSNRISVPFTVRAADGGELVVEVRVDGRPAQVDQLALPDRFDGSARGIATLSVPSHDSVVQIVARDRHGTSEPLSFKIERANPVVTAPAPEAGKSAAAPRATLYVLAVGISKYQRKEYELGLAAKDARDFARALESQRGRQYKDVVVKVLADGDASRAAIQDGLKWLSSSGGPDDIAMLFVAGHGLNDARGQYFFLPHDGDHQNLPATAVPETSIREALAKIRGRALFFVDTCYAGNVIGGNRPFNQEVARLANTLAASENGVIVFASSSGRQLSEEHDDWGNGAFTKALLEGLSGGADLNRTGRITYKGLDFFVSEAVSRLTNGRQTPVTISPVGVGNFDVAAAAVR
jgi:hypothetical protein